MAKWSDFETHPVGTSDRIKELEAALKLNQDLDEISVGVVAKQADRIKELEQRVASLEAVLDQAMWETIYYDDQLKNMCNLFAKAETGRQVLLGRVEELEQLVASLEAKLSKTEGLLAKAVGAGIDVAASLNAASSLLERGGKKAALSDKMFAQMLVDYSASLDRFRTTLAAVSETHKLKGQDDE